MVGGGLTVNEVWEIASQRLREKNKYSFTHWFEPMVPLRIEEDALVLGVPDEYFGQLVEDFAGDFLFEALQKIGGVDYRHIFEPGHCSRPSGTAPVSPAPAKSAAAPAEEPGSPEVQPELFDMEQPASAPAPAQAETDDAPAGDSGFLPPALSDDANCRLPRWNVNASTFENFIVGEDNRGAYTAAKAVAEEPGSLYNPLFLYGTNGIGKTHLLQAIAHEVSARREECRVRCVPCSDLVNDFYRLMSEHRNTVEFRDNLLGCDVLLIDDVHGLAKKVQMQEEFFSVFNTLIRRGKQIVMTCDRQPCEIADIDKRLTTRFESGVICQIGMPEYETRMVILRMWRKNILTNTWLPDDVLEFLATNIRSSVRRLKSAFMTLSFHASLSGKADLSVAEAEEQLHAQIAEELTASSISIELIQRTVAEFFNLTIADLLGTRRTRNVAEPRMIAMALARELTPDSSTAVGAAFGRNHATILHAEKQVEQLCARDEGMRRAVLQIKRKLQK